MKTIVAFISADKKVKRIIRPTERFMNGDPSYGDYAELARATCIDAGDAYYGFQILEA